MEGFAGFPWDQKDGLFIWPMASSLGKTEQNQKIKLKKKKAKKKKKKKKAVISPAWVR